VLRQLAIWDGKQRGDKHEFVLNVGFAPFNLLTHTTWRMTYKGTEHRLICQLLRNTEMNGYSNSKNFLVAIWN
jgi:hypothetical protein